MENENRTLNDTQCYIIKEDQTLLTIASKDFSFIVEDNLEIIFNAFNTAGVQLNLMQNSAISFMACFNADERKIEKLTEILSAKFDVSVNHGHTLLTVFNYSETNSEVKNIIDGRKIALEQKSNSALQLLLI